MFVANRGENHYCRTFVQVSAVHSSTAFQGLRTSSWWRSRCCRWYSKHTQAQHGQFITKVCVNIVSKMSQKSNGRAHSQQLNNINSSGTIDVSHRCPMAAAFRRTYNQFSMGHSRNSSTAITYKTWNVHTHDRISSSLDVAWLNQTQKFYLCFFWRWCFACPFLNVWYLDVFYCQVQRRLDITFFVIFSVDELPLHPIT